MLEFIISITPVLGSYFIGLCIFYVVSKYSLKLIDFIIVKSKYSRNFFLWLYYRKPFLRWYADEKKRKEPSNNDIISEN